MTAAFDGATLERFGRLLNERFGLRADPARMGDLSDALSARLAANQERPEAYFERLAEPRSAAAELRAIATLVTIGETHFFRHPDQFRALAEVALPDRAALAAGTGRTLRVLSAGCSAGEEPYSIAMLAAMRPDLLGGASLELQGIDLNPQAIARAKAGRYTSWSMRGVDPVVQARFFAPEGRNLQLAGSVLDRVAFSERNLVQDDPLFWRADAFDVIICRNVLIYFEPPTIRQVIARFAHALAPGGYLFLGPAETLRGISDEFHLLHTHGCFYYQRRGAQGPRDMRPLAPVQLLAPAPLVALPDAPDDAWAAAITGAADRIAALSATPSLVVEHGWERALTAFRRERFEEALAELDALGAGRANARDARLLRAAILTNAGRVTEAETACREAIARDEQDPGAHYLLALCRDHDGDPDGARRHDEAALYLDPAFAMPWLHLGLMGAKLGDRARAKDAFRRAAALLPGEPSARLDLFGGGFSRMALLGLVEAELVRLGEAS